MIERFARGDAVVPYPDYPEPIDWTYVDDAAEVLLRAIEQPVPKFGALNALGDRRRVRDAVAHLRRRFPGVIAEAIPAEPPPAAWGLRNDGIAAALGFVPSTTLEDGIDAMLRSVQKVDRDG